MLFQQILHRELLLLLLLLLLMLLLLLQSRLNDGLIKAQPELHRHLSNKEPTVFWT